jgi:hypothetical protein
MAAAPGKAAAVETGSLSRTFFDDLRPTSRIGHSNVKQL